MFYQFLVPLAKDHIVFNVFRYLTFRSFMALISALVISLIVGPWLIRRLRRMQLGGETIREDTPERHRTTKKGTPTMGGVIILTAILGSTVLAMSLSGALAGLAGTNEVLGLNHNLAQAFSSGYGFDSIALALLGKSHPLGVVLASLLFGTLRNGATRMQVVAQIPIDIITIMQAFILVFIAAPAIIRTIYRLRVPVDEEGVSIRGWGGD